MKKIILLFIMILIILFNYKLYSYAIENEETIDTESIIQSQKDNLKISDFLQESKKYSSDLLENIEIDDLFASAVSGNINTSSLGKNILEKFFKEFMHSISSIGLIIVVVLIHSILKSISDGLENSSVAQVSYYISYILVVTIIMKNFNEVIILMKSSINNLVTFVNCLFPILLTLLVSSGGITTAVALQPVILLLITVVSNIVIKVIIPFSLVSVALNIVSNISYKAQIGRLSKFINSSVIWTLGILLTIFVGVTSLEGSIGKRS